MTWSKRDRPFPRRGGKAYALVGFSWAKVRIVALDPLLVKTTHGFVCEPNSPKLAPR